MAYGDIGGPVTELIITCRTPASGAVSINRGDAVKLSGAYEATNDSEDEDAVLGQAMASSTENAANIPVKVRGICVFAYEGAPPPLNGEAGVVASAESGKVKAAASGNGRGINLDVLTASSEVHVLL